MPGSWWRLVFKFFVTHVYGVEPLTTAITLHAACLHNAYMNPEKQNATWLKAA